MVTKALALLLITGSIGCQSAPVPIAPPRSRPTKASNESRQRTYVSKKYGFGLRYPATYALTEKGSDSYEKQLLAGLGISGTQFPLFDSFDLNNGEHVVLTIDVPDTKALGPVVAGDYDWHRRPCGQSGFAEILSERQVTVGEQKTLQVTSRPIWGDHPLVDYYYCINYPPQPIIVRFSHTFRNEAEAILSGFRFQNDHTVSPTRAGAVASAVRDRVSLRRAAQR